MKAKLLKYCVIFLTCLYSFYNLFAQDFNKTEFADITIFQGFQNHSLRPLVLDEFRMLTSHSELLNSDFSGFVSPNWFWPSNTTSSSFGINIGLKFFDANKGDFRKNIAVNIGLIYNTANMYASRYEKTERTLTDTFVSASSGGIIYRDSLYNEYYTMYYNTEQIGLNSNLIFRYNPEGRWSLYAGVGVMASLSIRAETQVEYFDNARIEYTLSNQSVGTQYFFISFSEKEEVHKNKMNVFAMAYVPLGVDFRLGKNNEFWKRIHLIMEMQPGIAVYNFPELDSFFTGTFNGNMGLRVEF